MSQPHPHREVITREMLKTGEPLPFNIHTEDGTLLLRKGVILYSEQQIETLISRGSYTIPEVEEPESQPIKSTVQPNLTGADTSMST